MMRVLDLFSGCGGLSHGLSMAGVDGYDLDVVGGLDFHPPSVATFEQNHPNAASFEGDIRKSDIDSIMNAVGPIDLLVGGPSCQGFSTHGKRIADDPRNFLYTYFMRFVDQLKPTWVLMENVTGLLRYNNGAFRDNIIEDFNRMGYVVSFAQLQAADFGVPQIRKRVIFIANRRGIPFYFPLPTHASPDALLTGRGVPGQKPYVTVADAIGDLPSIGRGCSSESAPLAYAVDPFTDYQSWIRRGADALSLHYGTEVPEDNYARIRHIPQGGDWLDIPDHLMPERFNRVLRKDCTTLFYRLRWDRPGYTITTVYRNVSSGAFTHPDEDRALTHREAARIQSFPDAFQFNPISIGRQIGNAVPPLLATVLGRSIIAHDRLFQGTQSLRDLQSFEAEIRLAQSRPVVPPMADQVRVECPPLEPLKGVLAPVTDGAWRQLDRPRDLARLDVGSQVDVRGVLNALAHSVNNGRNLLTVPTEYSHPATVIRMVQKWHVTDLEKLAALAARAVETAGEGGEVSRLGGEQRETKRRRPHPYSRHHFATVLYPIDPETKCSMIR